MAEPWSRTASLVLILLCLAVSGVAVSAGCSDDNEDGAATEAIGTDAEEVGDSGAVAAAVNAYVEQVRELVGMGDQLNSSYRDLVDRYYAKQATAEDVIAAAGQNAIAYQDMTAQLEKMTVPEVLEAAHAMILSGFAKWQQMYEFDSRGLQEENSELLARASTLDSEAVAEVNEAISEINRMKER